MLDFLKRKKKALHDNTPNSEQGLGVRLRKWGLKDLFSNKNGVDESSLEALKTVLLSSDVGVTLTEEILTNLTARFKQGKTEGQTILEMLKAELAQVLLDCEVPLTVPSGVKPFVILMVGVNGAGKTTTIGKLAKKFQKEGKRVLMAAGDTFRAAAIEQLKVWGERNAIPVIAQNPGADSASVIFDALQAAKTKEVDVLIADTAGRLHTQDPLMEELKKVIRIMRKIEAKAPHEILLVLDAGIGQNALVQAKKFHEALGVTGIAITKLDGTAKGGILFNIARNLKIPIRFIGVGEGIEDLKPFEAASFVDALF